MRILFALAPLAVVGLGVLSWSPLDANAEDAAAAGAIRAVSGHSPGPRLSRRGSPLAVIEGRIAPPRAGACPPSMANVDQRFCVDRWEASLVERGSDGAEIPWSPFKAVEQGHDLVAVSQPGVYPQGYISGAQAAHACAAAGKRLCAPVEWRKACRGPDDRKFGYGTQRVAGRCNDRGRSPVLRYYPNFMTPTAPIGFKEMNDPRLNQLTGTLSPTGAHEDCTNDYGVYDMVGNLHEWTSDPNGTFQGGYYLDTHTNGDGCTYRTVAHDFVYHDYSTGFRCCEDLPVPEAAPSP